MKRRLYFLFPDAEHAGIVVKELQALDIGDRSIHAIAGRDSDLTELPGATESQRYDLAARVERFTWGANLTTFFAASLVLLLSVLLQLAWYWLLIPAALMVVSFVLGFSFATYVPNVHLAEFHDALQHREILLMVDIPATRVAEVEERVHRQHPEAVVGGVGWSVGALQL